MKYIRFYQIIQRSFAFFDKLRHWQEPEEGRRSSFLWANTTMLPTSWSRLRPKSPAKERDNRGKIALKMARCYDKINSTPKAIAAYRNAIRYNQASLDDRLAYAPHALEKRWVQTGRKEFRIPHGFHARQRSCQERAWKSATNSSHLEERKKADIRWRRWTYSTRRRDDYSPMLLGEEYDQLWFHLYPKWGKGDELSGYPPAPKPETSSYQKKTIGENGANPKPLVVDLIPPMTKKPVASLLTERKCILPSAPPTRSSPRYAQIVTSSLLGCSLGKTSQLQITRDTLSSYAHPAISPDGEWLYFVSDMPGGVRPALVHLAYPSYGCRSWRCQRISVNPSTHRATRCSLPSRPDGDLYFSSNGHVGMGGLDIFIRQSRQEDSEIPTGASGLSTQFRSRWFRNDIRGSTQPWFTSHPTERTDEAMAHIYSFENPEIVTTMKGWVYEMDGYELPAAQVMVVGNDEGPRNCRWRAMVTSPWLSTRR